jgi:hypothetical protein
MLCHWREAKIVFILAAKVKLIFHSRMDGMQMDDMVGPIDILLRNERGERYHL